MSIKIQLNSLDALERLIGGDSTVEVEIRNSIVQEFAKRHLKSIAESTVNGLTFAAREACNEKIKEVFGQYDSDNLYYRKFILNPDLQTTLREQAKLAVGDEIKAFVKDEVQKYLDHRATDKFFYSSMKEYVDKVLTGPLFHNAVIEEVEVRLKKILEGLKVNAN